MPLNAIVGGGEYSVNSASVIVGGVAKTVRRIEAWNGSAWKVVKNFAPAMSASANNPEVYATGTQTSLTTNSVTITPSGGQAPYTYAWSLYGGDTANITSPTFATTTFSQNVGPGESLIAQFQCVVTDSLGSTASVIVTAYFTNLNPF